MSLLSQALSFFKQMSRTRDLFWRYYVGSGHETLVRRQFESSLSMYGLHPKSCFATRQGFWFKNGCFLRNRSQIVIFTQQFTKSIGLLEMIQVLKYGANKGAFQISFSSAHERWWQLACIDIPHGKKSKYFAQKITTARFAFDTTPHFKRVNHSI